MNPNLEEQEIIIKQEQDIAIAILKGEDDR